MVAFLGLKNPSSPYGAFFLRLPVITKAHDTHMVGNMGLNSTFCYCNIPVGFNTRLGRTGFKGEVDSQQISQQDSSNYALKLVESLVPKLNYCNFL